MDLQPPAILVVEDEPGVLALVSRLLGRAGYRVLTAGGPEEALAITAADRAIDLVLCDVVMPRRSGRDVVAQIQALSGGTRALFMSGHAADALKAKGTLHESSAFIQKPFTASELIGKVREVLQHAEAIR